MTAHHPDQGIPGEWAYVILLTAAVAVAVALVWFQHPAAGAVTWLAAGLSGVAAVGVSIVLVVVRRAERLARELALHQLDQSRRAAAVAQDLRAETQRLRDDVARLVAHADISGYPARGPVRPILGP
jgi:hypothetical protein